MHKRGGRTRMGKACAMRCWRGAASLRFARQPSVLKTATDATTHCRLLCLPPLWQLRQAAGVGAAFDAIQDALVNESDDALL